MPSHTEKFTQGSVNMIKLIIADSKNYKFSRKDSKTATGSISTELICYDRNGEKLFKISKSNYDPHRGVKVKDMKETEAQYAIQILGSYIILNTESNLAENHDFFKIIDKKIAETKPDNSLALKQATKER